MKTVMDSLLSSYAGTPMQSDQPQNRKIGLTGFPTGESRNGGGREFDTQWHVEKYRSWWIGSFVTPFTGDDRLFIAIMPAHEPWELAVDSFLDFIDRLREGRIPRDIETPIALIEMTNQAARRQR
jgi:hypothetical protein